MPRLEQRHTDLGAFAVAFAFQHIRAGVAGRNRPAEVGSEKTPASLAAEARVGGFLPVELFFLTHKSLDKWHSKRICVFRFNSPAIHETNHL